LTFGNDSNVREQQNKYSAAIIDMSWEKEFRAKKINCEDELVGNLYSLTIEDKTNKWAG
jgi:hypothetical protein